jgi:hypothetical protein
VFAVTASSQDRGRTEDRGPDPFDVWLLKPILADQLLARIGSALAIEWIYGASAVEDVAVEGTTGDRMGPLPGRDDRIAMLALAETGDLAGVRARAAELVAADPALAPFAARLYGLADEFDNDGICRLLA